MKKLGLMLVAVFCMAISAQAQDAKKSCSKKCTKTAAKECTKKADTKVASVSMEGTEEAATKKATCTKSAAKATCNKGTKVASASMTMDADGNVVCKETGEKMSIEECAKKMGISVEECKKMCAKSCSKSAAKTCTKSKAKMTATEAAVPAEAKKVVRKAEIK